MAVRDSAIDEIKARCNIVDVIGRVVPLKKAGVNYKGVCPFHNEKTPSFVVSEHKQIFTCFGCGASGDVIEFVKRYYNLDFMEAVERLANEYGIEIKHSGGASSEYKEKQYEINRLAAKFFFKNMIVEGSPGYAYMYNRGISQETIKKFGIGYAPDTWDSLKKYMEENKVEPEILVKLGLLSESKGRYYDKFRNRVIFPIINTRGKIIGFGGRIIGDGTPKYLNSPESEIFLKKNNLYGINLAREHISREDCAILVEGYMDVVSLYQNGIMNVSASLGTALTENQAKMLKRYTKNVILSYDADNAGRAAALRGIEILHAQEIKSRVLHVTQGKDPDEFVKKFGKSAFLELADNAPGYADYRIETIMNRHDLAQSDGRIDFVKESASVLSSLSPAEQDIYIKKIAKLSGISEGAIRMELNGSTPSEGRYIEQRNEKPVSEGISALEKNLIKLLITDISTFDRIAEIRDAFCSPCGSEIVDNISRMKDEGDEINLNKLYDSLSEESISALNDISENVVLGGKIETVLEESMAKYKLERLKKRYDEITQIIGLAGESENQDKVRSLIAEQMDILVKMQQLKERR